MKEMMEQRGALRITMIDQAGEMVLDKTYKNRIVAKGRELVARLFSDTEGDLLHKPLSHIELGEGKTDVKDTDDKLENPRSGAKRKGLKESNSIECRTVDEEGIKRTILKVTAIYDYNEANGEKPICEAGLFNGEGDDAVMYNRVVFDPVYKKQEFKLTLQWEIVF